MNDNSKGGITAIGLLQVCFIILKMLHLIDWAWIWVLAPIWIELLLVVVIVLIKLRRWK